MFLTERSKALYQPWSQETFNADLHVRRMTNVQRWIYKSLLQEAFVCSSRPRLPDDDEELWIMADCDNIEQWLENKQVIVRMFERTQEGGVPLLTHKKLEEDWDRLQEKRDARVEAGRKGGLAKSSKAKQTVANPAKRSEVREEKRSEGEEVIDPDSENPLNGQEDQVNLKGLKASVISIAKKYEAKAGGSNQSWDRAKALAEAYGSGAFLKEFEQFMKDNQGDDFQYGSLAAFLYCAEDRLAVETPQESEDAATVSVIFDQFAYLSDRTIMFTTKQKAVIAEAAKKYSEEEIIAVFKEWFATQDTSTEKSCGQAAAKFTTNASALAYSLRRTRAEKVSEGLARQKAVERLQEAANAEREEAERKRKEEEAQFNPIADLMS
jgi:hypothetical protein